MSSKMPPIECARFEQFRIRYVFLVGWQSVEDSMSYNITEHTEWDDFEDEAIGLIEDTDTYKEFVANNEQEAANAYLELIMSDVDDFITDTSHHVVSTLLPKKQTEEYFVHKLITAEERYYLYVACRVNGYYEMDLLLKNDTPSTAASTQWKVAEDNARFANAGEFWDIVAGDPERKLRRSIKNFSVQVDGKDALANKFPEPEFRVTQNDSLGIQIVHYDPHASVSVGIDVPAPKEITLSDELSELITDLEEIEDQ